MTPRKSNPKTVETGESVRTGTSVAAFKRSFLDNLFYIVGRFPEVATRNDNYMALAYTVRDRLLDRWIRSSRTYSKTRARTVCYLSAEFLLGPHLGNNLINMGLEDVARQVMQELGLSLEELLAQEEEPGLGSGGLGRLAACYMDSLSTLQIPAIGYGIRYEFGIFDQQIHDGEADRAGERGAVPGVAEVENARAGRDRVVDRRAAEDGADGRVSGSEALPDRDDVGLDRDLVGRKPAPHAAHPRDHLVEADQEPVLLSTLSQTSPEALRRRVGG